MSEHIVLIGAYGWFHPQWDGEFYPDDLPLDWKIGYYGNEYPVVVVPQTYWTQYDGDQEAWLQDCDESLEFIAEWPTTGASASAYEQATTGLASLQQRVIAVLVPITSRPTDSEWQKIENLSQDNPLSFDVEPALRADFEAELTQRLPQADVGFCCHGERFAEQDLKRGSVAICRLKDVLEAKELRHIFEKMIAADAQAGHERTMVFIADGTPPELKLLTNAGIILDLL